MATNFLPSLQVNKKNLDIEGWTPRANFSGPIAKGRAWFFNAADIQYDLSVVNELPAGADTGSSWQGSDLTRVQVNLTNRNILTSGFLFNFTDSNHFGLSPRDPIETTRDVNSRYYFLNVKDQAFLAGGSVLEVGVAASRLNADEQAMGDKPYVIGPGGNSGNYFADSEQEVDRLQVVASMLVRPLSWHGRHDLKFGIDADDNRYRQFSLRRSFEIRNEQGIRVRTVSFSGDPHLGQDDAEFSAYIQDRWSPQERLLVEAGLRLDWDQVLGDTLVSPRFAVTYTPSRIRDSKFSAGVGVFYDATNLGLLARGLDQVRTDTFYSQDGSEIIDGPIVSRYVVDRASLQAPFSLNWSLGWEQKLPGAIYFATNFIRRQGRRAWAYSLVASGDRRGSARNHLPARQQPEPELFLPRVHGQTNVQGEVLCRSILCPVEHADLGRDRLLTGESDLQPAGQWPPGLGRTEPADCVGAPACPVHQEMDRSLFPGMAHGLPVQRCEPGAEPDRRTQLLPIS